MWDDHVFAHVLHRLARLGRLIVLDPRGIGTSDPVPLGALPTVEAWADDVRVVLDAVDSVSATMIANANFSGPLGLFYAATHPERIDALVLVNAAARQVTGDDYPLGTAARRRRTGARRD
jgi:pimeloyl-ACP methyl ester carboxylesterase